MLRQDFRSLTSAKDAGMKDGRDTNAACRCQARQAIHGSTAGGR
jgi:hypothetical protein